ncbi:hypothetical protein SpCBS45565_g03870 [Spizellomyces sp. 'palustris']|nr:hypothetical protein SpCBS45565_g03870 [Spizellomyces sp. 'palustris']
MATGRLEQAFDEAKTTKHGQEDDNLSILPTSTFMNQLSSENDLGDQADLLEMVERFDQWARINGHASHEGCSEKQENGNVNDQRSRIEETVLDPNEFMQSGPLIPIICNLLKKLYPTRADPLSQRITSEDCKFLTNELRNFKVQASHSYRRRYRITEITSETPTSTVLDVDGKSITVRDYFLERYGVQLAYPDFPCVAMKKPNGWSYLPCELCEIVQGQRISTKFWEIQDIPAYVEMDVSIPTVEQRWGIASSEWFKRLEHGVCPICQGKHLVRDCEVFRNVDGKIVANAREHKADMDDTTKESHTEKSEQSVQSHLDKRTATEPTQTSVESTKSKETVDMGRNHTATDLLVQSFDNSVENTLSTGDAYTAKETPSKLATTDQHLNPPRQIDAEGYINIHPTDKLKKKILKPGSGPAVEPQSFVQVHYEGWVDGPGGIMFDSSWDRGSTFDFTVGEGDVIPGWDMAVETMKMGEEAEFIVDSELAYGEKGYDPIIPPHAALRFTIWVMHVDPPQATLPARISESIALKTAGNTSFRSQDYPTAVKSYRSALHLLKHTWNAPPAQEFELQALRTALFSNLAAGLLHMGQHNDAIRGLKSIGEFAEALRVLEKAELFDPNNQSIVSERIHIKVNQRQLAKQEKKMYARMMSALSS